MWKSEFEEHIKSDLRQIGGEELKFTKLVQGRGIIAGYSGDGNKPLFSVMAENILKIRLFNKR
jgi:hypothetical protein